MNIFNFLGLDAEYEKSRIVFFGAPFDGTTSFRPGTRFAPAAMRGDSFGIETYSPYQDKDLEDANICDGGDLDITAINPKDAIAKIEAFAKAIFQDGKIPVMAGGEHLVSLGAIRAAAEKYPNLHIIHFDAHTDYRHDYLGEKLSHASVMRRAQELLGDGRIFGFGYRSGLKEEFEFAETHCFVNRFTLENIDKARSQIGDAPVYITVDLDVLDPSVFPGTGTPEAGGVSYNELQNALLALRGMNIVAADVCELSPHYDHTGVSTAVACKVLRELLLII